MVAGLADRAKRYQALTLLAGALLPFDGEGAVRRDRFQAATAPFLVRNPGVCALEWVPRVKAAARADMEADARKDGRAGFAFTEHDSAGNPVPAAPHDEYFPVYFIEPLAGAVNVVLVKTRTSDENILNTILSIIPAAPV